MFHSVEIRAFCHATEDESRVAAALQVLSRGGPPQVEKAEGHHGNPLLVMSSRLEGRDEIRGFWGALREAGVLAEVLRTLEDRVDEEGVLHLRFDKQRAFAGEPRLSTGDDVIAARAKVAAHPARRSTAVRVAREYLAGV